MSKIILATVAAIAVAGLSQTAMARDVNVQAKSQTLSTATVNFDNSADVSAFYAKIARTARQVCDSNSANPIVQQDDRACTERTINNAVRSVNKPMLTAMHNGYFGNDVRVASN